MRTRESRSRLTMHERTVDSPAGSMRQEGPSTGGTHLRSCKACCPSRDPGKRGLQALPIAETAARLRLRGVGSAAGTLEACSC